MQSKSEILATKRKIKAIYVVGFLFSLTVAIPAYIGSEFISLLIGKQSVGIVFATEAVATIMLLSVFGLILKKNGNIHASILALSFGILAVLGIFFLKTPILVILSFLLFLIVSNLFYLNLDVLLEKYTTNSSTGSIRGIFMSVSNSAWVISPLIAGFIISETNHQTVFLVAGLLLLPTILILLLNFKDFKDSPYKITPLSKLITILPKHKDTLKIWMSNFLLYFFYSWMVIYMPIYLHNDMGFDWKTIGLMFTLMLMPFVILEAPLGKLADERFGEKEMLSAGFIIIGLGTAFLGFIAIPDFWLFASGLVITRIGASMIEIMNETYFFKKCDASDSDMVSLFRMTRPIAYIVGPLAGSFFLLFTNYNYLLFILAGIMFLGLRYSLTIKDTK